MNSVVVTKVGSLVTSGSAWPLVLTALLEDENVRAAGLWRGTETVLEQVAFRAASAMPEAVRLDFAQRTASVPLSSTGLGIVQAWMLRETVVVRATDFVGAVDSANWLQRFGAAVSLSIPVMVREEVVGVLAVALTEPLAGSSPVWQDVRTLADLVARRWDAESSAETAQSRIADVQSHG